MRNEQLDKWMANWAKAQQTDAFKSAPKSVEKKVFSENVFGEATRKDKVVPKLKNVDTKYWNQVYKASKGERIINEQKIVDDPLGSEPIGKQRDVPGKPELGVKGAELANTGNPIYPSTRGDDTRKHVTPDWADGVKLRELVNMKHSLYELEVKLNS